ncbi:MAG: BatD family protein [bacterium]
MKLYILFLNLIFFSSGLGAQEISFEASVDKNILGIDEQLTLSITISGGNLSGLPIPQLPPLKDFDIVNSYRSQSISIVNVQVSTSLEIKYVLVPKGVGHFTLPAITLNHKEKTYQTKPIEIEVTGQGKATPPPSQSPSSIKKLEKVPGNLFLDAQVNKRTVFVNEQVTLNIKFYQRINLWESSGYTPPSFTGFWVEDLPVSKQPTKQNIDGLTYLVHEVVNKALFPTTEGEYTIGETSMSCVVSPFQEPILLKTNPIKIKVLPLPQNKPKNFSGAIGDFLISSEVDKKIVEENQPINLKVKIKGEGNIKTIPQPSLPRLIDFKVYSSGEVSSVSNSEFKICGEKEYKYILIPTSPGKHILEPIILSYFNPETKRYEMNKTPRITIIAKPASSFEKKMAQKQEVRILKKDIRYIKEPLNLTNQSSYLYQNKLFLLLQVLPVLSIVVTIFYKRHLIRAYQRYSRLKRIKKKALKGLSRAKGQLGEKTKDEFYGTISKTILEYLGDKLNLLPNEITIEVLETKELNEEILNEVQNILKSCDYARYAPSTYTLENMEEILIKAKECIAKI